MDSWNPKKIEATFKIHSSIELEIQEVFPEETRWGCPVISGRMAGLCQYLWQHEVNLEWEDYDTFTVTPQEKVSPINLRLDSLQQENLHLREVNQQVQQVNEAKSMFLANMSHEIRTPMNGVIGMTNLLAQTSLNKEQGEFVEIIRSSSESLLGIINDILDFSKIEAGKIELESHPVDVHKLFEESMDIIVTKAYEKGLETVFYGDPSLPSLINGDSTRIRQILVNLLSNAVKFTESGEIVVLARSESMSNNKARITVSVKDTGIGISEDKQRKLFDPFTQADSSTTRKFGGTGLGLSISNQLCKMMGGEMWVESREGEGSTFYFSFIADILKEATDQEDHHEKEQLKDKKILIVDDNTTNLQILRTQLGIWGVSTKIASSGEEALPIIHQDPAIDLVLLDYQMPGMDGAELARKIRVFYPKLPLIMLSSIGLRISDELVDYSLNKPVKVRQLQDTILYIFGRKTELSQDPSKSQEALSTESLAKVRILLAEDNLVNQKVALRTLKKFGIDADVANNGREVLEQLQNHTYDLVLMDVQMPIMTGIEATEKIRQDSAFGELPIIAMTASAMQGDREACLEAGMNGYISKPFKQKELLEIIQKYVTILN